MNITYIVGKALDLQYGLKTRYKDFYEFQNKVYISRKENEEEYSNFIYESLFSDEVNDYENFLKDAFSLMNQYAPLEKIDWLIKKES